MIFTCTKFTGHWPVGAAAVVLADSHVEAAHALNQELRKRGLPGDVKPEQMNEFKQTYRAGATDVLILVDGDY